MKSVINVNNGRIVCKLSTLHWANQWVVMDGHTSILECERVSMGEYRDMMKSIYGGFEVCECFETATGETFMHFKDIDFDGHYIVKLEG